VAEGDKEGLKKEGGASVGKGIADRKRNLRREDQYQEERKPRGKGRRPKGETHESKKKKPPKKKEKKINQKRKGRVSSVIRQTGY